MRLRRLSGLVTAIAVAVAWTGVISPGTANALTTDVVVRPGSLHGWAVNFTTNAVQPGFVTGPAGGLGDGAFRFDTGAPGAARAGAKVELSNGGLNDQPLADLTALHFDVYLEENDPAVQPYVTFKVDADNDGSIDTNLAYNHTAIPVNSWTTVDTMDGSATGATGWFCQSSTVVTCGPGGMTWDQVLELLPDEAVFQNSAGFPRSMIFNAGQSASARGVTVRGAVDKFTWGLGDAVVQNDFEPPLISAPDTATTEPATGSAPAEVPISLSGPNGFRSVDAPLAGRHGQPVTVHYATADGTATAGEDYTPVSGTLTFDPSTAQTTLPVSIPILPDAVADDGETVLIHLSAAVNGVIQRATATLTITAQGAPVVVRPGSLHGWAVNFTGRTVRPGFVTGPAGAPLGEGSFRFDTGAPGAAAAGAKVEFSNGGLNDQPLVDLTALHFDVYLDENDPGVQPALNLKIDADNNGSIDTSLAYVHTPIPLDTWTTVDTMDGSATGSTGWFCLSSTVVACPVEGQTWDEVLDLLGPDAVFQNSAGFPRSLIFTAGQSASAAGVTVRGAVDNLTWSLGDAVVQNDFEPPLISAPDTTTTEPATGTAFAKVPVNLSGRNGFRSIAAPLAGRHGQPVTVEYATADGTATAGDDYTPVSDTLTFDPSTGEITLPISIPILSDAVADDGETVLIHLSTPVNGHLERTTITLTINDSTPPPGYVPLTPERLLDTRHGTGAPAGFAPAGSTTELLVSGKAGIPASAKAVVLNVTVIQPKVPGFVTVYPCGGTRPTASNLNYSANQTIANMVVVALPASGEVCFYTTAESHLVADVSGYFSKNSDFEPMSPRRLADTRSSVTPPTKLPAGSTFSVPVTARFGIAEDAAAAALNVTVVQPSSPGYVTAYPCGAPRPTASTLNYSTGQTVPNAVLAKAGDGGRVCFYTTASTHLLVDAMGWFPADTDFRSLTPERLLDTRSGLGHPPAGMVPAGQVVELKVTGTGTSNVPADAGAVVLNVTATEPQQSGYVTVYPCGDERPTASTLNYSKGKTTPNAAITKVGAGGKVCLYNASGSTHLFVDINGWFPAT